MGHVSEKTIYYAIVTGSTTGLGFLNSNVVYSIGTQSIFIPEHSASMPVTFSSVYTETYFRDITTATGNNVNRQHVALTISGTRTVVSESNSLANSGENLGGIFGPCNFTNAFTSSIGPNTSSRFNVSCDVFYTQSGGTTVGMRGVSTLLGVTYIYDSAQPTQSKSIIIPLNSVSGALSTVVNHRFAEIPILRSGSEGSWSGYLVEASASIEDYFILIEGQTQTQPATTDYSASYRIDGAGGGFFETIEGALQSDIWIREIIKFATGSVPDLATTHSLNLWSGLATRFHNLTAKLYVTYTFIPSLSNQVCNSYKLALEFDSPVSGGALTSSGSAQIFYRNLQISDPSPITLKNSSAELYFFSSTSPSLSVRAISQSRNIFYTYPGTAPNGMYQVIHPLTSFTSYSFSASYNAFPTFSGGENPFFLEIYRTNANPVTNISGYLYLNYVSATSSLGIPCHPHTVEYVMRSMSMATSNELTYQFQPTLAQLRGDENWWLSSIGIDTNFWAQTTVNFLANDVTIIASESLNPYYTNDGLARGYKRLYSNLYQAANELTFGRWVVRARSEFKRQPRDPDTDRLHPTGSRGWRTVTQATGIRYGNKLFATYHQLTGSLGGTISNSNGGTVLLKLFKATSNELIDSTSRTGDGTYTFVTYDPYENHFVTAYEDNTHKGRSKNDVPGSGFDISLTGGGAPTYTEYWL